MIHVSSINPQLVRQIIATCVVSGIFTFFIINGPLQRIEKLLSLEVEETEFSNPIMLGKEQKVNKTDFITDVETRGFGHSLIINKKKEKQNFGLLTNTHKSLGHKESQQLIDHARTLFPNQTTALVSHGNNSYVKIDEEKDQSFYIESKYLIHDIIGYAGPINVGVQVSEEGNILSVHHISSLETQSYLHKIKQALYYPQYEHLSLEKASTIDGVSGATITTKAIAETTTETIKAFFPEPFENLIADHKLHRFSVESEISDIWILHASVLTVLFAFGLLKQVKKSKKLVSGVRIISILYLGFYLNNSFTYTSILHPFMGVTLSILSSVYIGLVLIGAIWGKNIYCKYVCPFGNAQCLLQQATPKKWSSKFFIPNRWLNYIRMAISLTLITGILLGLDNWKNFELFPDLFGTEYLSFWFGIALLFILVSIKYPMLWCRSLCPTGFVLDVATDLVHKGVKVKKQNKSVSITPPSKVQLPKLQSA